MKQPRRKKWDRKGSSRHLRRAAIRDGMDRATAFKHFPVKRTPVDAKAHDKWQQHKMQHDPRRFKIQENSERTLSRFELLVRNMSFDKIAKAVTKFKPATPKPGQRRSQKAA